MPPKWKNLTRAVLMEIAECMTQEKLGLQKVLSLPRFAEYACDINKVSKKIQELRNKGALKDVHVSSDMTASRKTGGIKVIL